jgi:hypothetical protein
MLPGRDGFDVAVSAASSDIAHRHADRARGSPSACRGLELGADGLHQVALQSALKSWRASKAILRRTAGQRQEASKLEVDRQLPGPVQLACQWTTPVPFACGSSKCMTRVFRLPYSTGCADQRAAVTDFARWTAISRNLRHQLEQAGRYA